MVSSQSCEAALGVSSKMLFQIVDSGPLTVSNETATVLTSSRNLTRLTTLNFTNPMNKTSVRRQLAREAKAIVALAFRNGPIESLHAGTPCPPARQIWLLQNYRISKWLRS